VFEYDDFILIVLCVFRGGSDIFFMYSTSMSVEEVKKNMKFVVDE
jgi:hypothetical protein